MVLGLLMLCLEMIDMIEEALLVGSFLVLGTVWWVISGDEAYYHEFEDDDNDD